MRTEINYAAGKQPIVIKVSPRPAPPLPEVRLPASGQRPSQPGALGNGGGGGYRPSDRPLGQPTSLAQTAPNPFNRWPPGQSQRPSSSLDNRYPPTSLGQPSKTPLVINVDPPRLAPLPQVVGTGSLRPPNRRPGAQPGIIVRDSPPPGPPFPEVVTDRPVTRPTNGGLREVYRPKPAGVFYVQGREEPNRKGLLAEGTHTADRSEEAVTYGGVTTLVAEASDPGENVVRYQNRHKITRVGRPSHSGRPYIILDDELHSDDFVGGRRRRSREGRLLRRRLQVDDDYSSRRQAIILAPSTGQSESGATLTRPEPQVTPLVTMRRYFTANGARTASAPQRTISVSGTVSPQRRTASYQPADTGRIRVSNAGNRGLITRTVTTGSSPAANRPTAAPARDASGQPELSTDLDPATTAFSDSVATGSDVLPAYRRQRGRLAARRRLSTTPAPTAVPLGPANYDSDEEFYITDQPVAVSPAYRTRSRGFTSRRRYFTTPQPTSTTYGPTEYATDEEVYPSTTARPRYRKRFRGRSSRRRYSTSPQPSSVLYGPSDYEDSDEIYGSVVPTTGDPAYLDQYEDPFGIDGSVAVTTVSPQLLVDTTPVPEAQLGPIWHRLHGGRSVARRRLLTSTTEQPAVLDERTVGPALVPSTTTTRRPFRRRRPPSRRRFSTTDQPATRYGPDLPTAFTTERPGTARREDAVTYLLPAGDVTFTTTPSPALDQLGRPALSARRGRLPFGGTTGRPLLPNLPTVTLTPGRAARRQFTDSDQDFYTASTPRPFTNAPFSSSFSSTTQRPPVAPLGTFDSHRPELAAVDGNVDRFPTTFARGTTTAAPAVFQQPGFDPANQPPVRPITDRPFLRDGDRSFSLTSDRPLVLPADFTTPRGRVRTARPLWARVGEDPSTTTSLAEQLRRRAQAAAAAAGPTRQPSPAPLPPTEPDINSLFVTGPPEQDPITSLGSFAAFFSDPVTPTRRPSSALPTRASFPNTASPVPAALNEVRYFFGPERDPNSVLDQLAAGGNRVSDYWDQDVERAERLVSAGTETLDVNSCPQLATSPVLCLLTSLLWLLTR